MQNQLMQNQRSIVGVWNATIKAALLPETFNGLWTFFADGNFLEVNDLRETNPGVWMASDKGYLLTFWGYLYDEQGKSFGKAIVCFSIHLVDDNHFTADGVCNAVDGEGKPMTSQFDGPAHIVAERLKVEYPVLDA